MFDADYYAQRVREKTAQWSPPQMPPPKPGGLDEIRKNGEYRITESARLQNDGFIDISMHPLGGKGPHVETPHYHDFFELIYVGRGGLVNIINGQDEVPLDRGRCLLMNPNTRHVLCREEEGSQIFNILLKRSFVEKTLINMIGSDHNVFQFFFSSIYEEPLLKNYLVFPLDERTERLLHLLIQEFCEENPFYEQMLVSILIMLFGQFARARKTTLEEECELMKQEGSLSEILRYLHMNYASVTLEDAARHFNYSSAYLSRMIKKKTGKTFSELVSGMRLDFACHYLKQSNLSIEQIAGLVGYQNGSNFFRSFKKQFGVSPSEFRKQYGERETT